MNTKGGRMLAAVALLCCITAVPAYGTTVLGYTSFEEPSVPGGVYTDTGDAGVDHALADNAGEPWVNYPATGGEIGYTAYYTNTRGDVGLTDGDFVGVTDYTGTVGAYTDGTNGYELSDCDGLMTVTFDTVALSGSQPTVFIDAFVQETGWEVGAPADDRIRIWVVVDGSVEIDLLNTAGSDIDDLGIEGSWMNLSANLTGNTTATLKIEMDSNSGSEALYVDYVIFTDDGTLPPQTGACCLSDDSCVADVSVSDCETVQMGTYLGNGTTCGPPNPCAPLGACCSPDYTCADSITEAECTTLDPTATWYEGEFCSLVCGPLGACCGIDGGCVEDVTEVQCTSMQGNSWTEGVGCVSMSCTTPSQQAVIISEYYESAPGNRKALELWNTTSSTISLNGHAIAAYANTATVPSNYFYLDDLQIGPYGTLVLVNDVDDIANEIAGLDEVYAIEAPSVVNFNGNDAVALMFGDVTLTPVIIDAFAVPGEADGGPRGTAPYKDAAWERDCLITVGASDFDSCNFDGLKDCALTDCPPGTPTDPVCSDGLNANQWVFEGLNPYDDNGNHSLGSHLCVAGIGACCDGSSCVLTDAATCSGLGGTFYADTPCNPLPCGLTGACCETNVLCVDDVTESECRAVSALATWIEGGTCAVDCPFTGACCIASNPGTPCACPGDMDLDLDVDSDDVPLFVNALLGLGSQACADVNGDTKVDGLDIAMFVQLALNGTTCLCNEMTEADCLSAGGTYEGDGSTCDPLPCGPTGACCSADYASCTDDLTIQECAALDDTATWYVGETCAESCTPEIPEGLVINEFWADDNDGLAGPDQAEFIELYCPTCGGANLSGMSVIVVEGDDSTTPNEFRDRRVLAQYNLTGYTMPVDGYFLLAGGNLAAVTNQEVDYEFDLGDLQNGAQTYAIVRTSDIAYDEGTEQLSLASVAAITANLIDGISAIADSPNNNSYFGAPTIGPMGSGFAPDTASRIPNGVDTDSTGDWTAQDNYPAVLLYDANDLLSTPGYANTTTILGVCCDENSSCSELTKTDCEDGTPIGGIWQGRFLDVNCSDPNINPCLPSGACCLPDLSCVIANQDICEITLLGTYKGDDTLCDPDPCAATGSCCLPGTICYDDLTNAECTALSGGATWTEAGTCLADCSGACCTDSGCQDLPRNECLALDPAGVFLGPATECATATCPAADYCLIISEVVDGDVTGGTPKFVEITNTSATEDFTFAAGGLIAQTNADTGTAVDIDLTGVTIAAGASYVICNSANSGDVVFLDTYGFDADLYVGGFWGGNGDDRYMITDTADGSNIIDIYGEYGVDGTGSTWEYLDSFAEREAAVSKGNRGTFDEDNWFIPGVGGLDGGGDDPTAKILLVNNTNPGTHFFTPCAREIVDCTGSCTTSVWCQYTVIDGGDCFSLNVNDVICVQCEGDCPDAGTDIVFTWIDGAGAGFDCTFTARSLAVTPDCLTSCSGVRSFENAP